MVLTGKSYQLSSQNTACKNTNAQTFRETYAHANYPSTPGYPPLFKNFHLGRANGLMEEASLKSALE